MDMEIPVFKHNVARAEISPNQVSKTNLSGVLDCLGFIRYLQYNDLAALDVHLFDSLASVRLV